jgi:hypothetical protein
MRTVHPIPIAGLLFTLVVLAGACSEVSPQLEQEPVQLEGLDPTADRLDTIAWLEEQTYGQAVTTVYQDTLPSCGSCEIELVPVGSFGRVEDEVLLVDIPVRVQRDSRGRFYAVAVGWTLEVIVYEPDGSIVRTVGRQGEGPGEFRHTVTDLLIGPGDSLFVAHDGLRLSVFDSSGTAASTRLLDTGASNARMLLVEASDDEVVLSFAPPHSAEELQLHPLHAFDRDGTLVRSFGPVGVEPLQHARLLPERPIRTGGPWWTSSAPDGALWVWSASNYRLERIGRASGVDRVIGVVNPDAWHGQLTMSFVDEEGTMMRQMLTVSGFHQFREDLGVAVLSVASPGWEQLELRRHPRFPADLLASDVHQELRDSVIDIIHIPTGEVLARKRIPEPSYLTSDGTLYSVTVSELGVIQVQAFEVELVGFEASGG